METTAAKKLSTAAPGSISASAKSNLRSLVICVQSVETGPNNFVM